MYLMRKPSILLLALLVLLALTGWTYLDHSAPAVAAQSSSIASNNALSSPASAGTLGIPAIHPRTTTADAATPAFTRSDVEQFINNNPMPRILGPWKPVIVKVMFSTSLQVSTMLGENTGVPDATLLCYVELQGTISFASPDGTPVTYQRGYEVFDAHTGNLLIVGGLN
jgi:hypothetical protein